MTALIATDARTLIGFAQRMGIPTGQAIRHAEQILAKADRRRDTQTLADLAEFDPAGRRHIN